MSTPASRGAATARSGNGALSGSGGGSGIAIRGALGASPSRGARLYQHCPASSWERAASPFGAVATVNAVRPAQMRSPGTSPRSPSSGSPLTTVPFVDPASATDTEPPATLT